jgi:hypothetical protein
MATQQRGDDPVDDKQEIQELHQLYAWAIDSRNPDLFDQVFTPDAVIDITPFGVFDRDSWRENARSGARRLDATMHFCGPAVIRVDEDRAISRCYFMAQHALNQLRPEPLIMIGGTYDDELVREGSRWWIARRTGTSLWWQGNPAVLVEGEQQGAFEWGPRRETPAWLTFG